jgi:N-acetylglutamate synthase-like GNAT family acetyltransferase
MPTLVFREAVLADLPAVSRLYAQLNLADPPLARSVETAAFQQILSREGMHILLLEREGVVIGTTYLNLIPNLTRSASPYAVIENVVVEETLRGQGLGRQLMARTLDAASQLTRSIERADFRRTRSRHTSRMLRVGSTQTYPRRATRRREVPTSAWARPDAARQRRPAAGVRSWSLDPRSSRASEQSSREADQSRIVA